MAKTIWLNKQKGISAKKDREKNGKALYKLIKKNNGKLKKCNRCKTCKQQKGLFEMDIQTKLYVTQKYLTMIQ